MTPIGKRRSRIPVGCQRCRVRHLKCDSYLPSCAACELAGVHCRRSFNVRFRNGLELDDEELQALSRVVNSSKLTGPFRIYDETREIESLYEDATAKEQNGEDITSDHPCVNNGPALEDYHTSGQTVTSLKSLPQLPRARSILANRAPKTIATPIQTNSSDINVCCQDILSLSRPDLHQSLEDALFGARRTELTDDYLVQSSPLDEREATLMRNFVENMALWADATDPHQHFGVEVPLRAMSEPVLKFSIFAFSSRHLDRLKIANSAEALHYHNRCLQLLIPILSDPENRVNDIVLAAVAILRQLEEMDWEDNQFHLTGTTHILNTVSRFGSSGGLGEAAAWLCLREDIQISLTSQQPLRTNLESFGGSDTFTRTDDYACANRMVFLLAKLLKVTFNNTMTHPAVLDNLEEEIEDWNTTKPHSFRPIRFVPRGEDMHQRFPEIWMLLPVHVVGVQYYHIAKIVLAFTQSSSPSRTYANLRNSRSIEKAMRRHLLLVLGLAKSNPKAENTLFTARHSLVAWGWVLRHKLDQEAAENLLQDMEAKTGWDVAQSIQALRGLWNEEDSDN